MIEELIVRDFQAHAKTRVRFGPGITSIVGASDVGKSSIIRALRWVCTNKPGGEAFIRDGAANTKVTLRVDGHVVARARGKRGNTYKLDGSARKSFGAAPPDDVARVLNVTPATFQGQHDAPFWFAETAGDVSRNLNQIIDLGAIDETLSRLGTKLRAETIAADAAQSVVERARERRAALAWATDADKSLRRVEELGRVAAETRARATLLGRLVADAREHVRRADRAAECVRTLLAVVAAGDRWAKTDGSRIRLVTIIAELRRCHAIADRSVPDASRADAAAQRWQTATAQIRELCDAITRASMAKVRVVAAERAADELESEFHETMGATCPLCNQPVTPS